MNSCIRMLLACGLCLWSADALAQEARTLELDLEETLTLALERAPAIADARTRVELARAELIEADVYQPHNPVLDLAGGPRFETAENVSPNLGVGLSQTFELGGRRSARVDVANSSVEAETHGARDVAREHLRAVAQAYLAAVHAEERLEIARASLALADRFLLVAQKRLDAGEINQLELNTARLTHGRYQIELRTWQGRAMRRRAQLKTLLGLEAGVKLELEDAHGAPALPPLEELVTQAAARPDLQALQARLQAEQARARLAQALAWPDLGLSVRYAREEGADIVMGGLSVTLPLFVRGQAVAARSQAETVRVRELLAARQRAIAVELRALYARYETLRETQVDFRQEVLPVLEQNENMVRQAYEAGSVDLPDLLAMRRETIEAREAFVDLSLEAALAEVEIRAIAGTLAPQQTSRGGT